MNILVNGTNVGTELQQVVLFTNANGGVSFPANALGHLKEINARQQSTKVTISPVIYNGKRIHRNIYHDFAGELMFSRFNGDITNLILGIVNRFQSLGAETYFSLYTNIFNSTLGTIDEYLFQQLVLDDHDLGRWNGTSEVDVSIAFRCQSLIIAGSPSNVLAQGPSVQA